MLTSTTTFMVKSAYSKFKANMSSGVTVTVTPTGDVTPSPTTNWRIEMNGGNNITVAAYYNLLNEGKPIKVLDSGYDVTRNASITTTCWNKSNNNEVPCETLDCHSSYDIQHTATYNNKTKSVSRSLTAGC